VIHFLLVLLLVIEIPARIEQEHDYEQDDMKSA